MEKLKHFSHQHMLYLTYLQQTRHIIQNYCSSDDDDEEEEDDDLKVVVQEEDQQQHGGQCKMCEERIYSFHLCYYKCHECDDDYSLHKFCAELPLILKNHPLHDHPAGHQLTLSKEYQFTEPSLEIGDPSGWTWKCHICKADHTMFYNYHCAICKFTMGIVCATTPQQKMVHPNHHPDHDHQLQHMFGSISATCDACATSHNDERGTYHCNICSWFWIHLDCALLPTKLSIQRSTKDTFTHSHLLTLASSFPYIDQKPKFFPSCKVCDHTFFDNFGWLYKCDKCRYYVHFGCATSPRAGRGSTYKKNFNDTDHPNLLHCPFPDESCNLLKHYYFYNRKEEFFAKEKYDDDDERRLINRVIHPHPLILVFDTTTQASISLHDPMKKTQLLCDVCVRPITPVPFYKCSGSSPQYNVENTSSSSSSSSSCGGFVLHEWCAKLPSQLHDHPGHPQHTLLLLLPKALPSFRLAGVFRCQVCLLLCNGFAYGCTTCGYYVDINCSRIPEEITHEAHPHHLLRRITCSDILSTKYCKACRFKMKFGWGFHCPSCDFYIHTGCALLLPRQVRHKYDKHPLSLRYGPVENHPQEYFCEICEDGIYSFSSGQWFYHCTTCAWSMHAACVPLILQTEQALYSEYPLCVFLFLNVKFGREVEIKDTHPHTLTFVQGIESHGQCSMCDAQLQYRPIFKCLECDQFAIHYQCLESRLIK